MFVFCETAEKVQWRKWYECWFSARHCPLLYLYKCDMCCVMLNLRGKRSSAWRKSRYIFVLRGRPPSGWVNMFSRLEILLRRPRVVHGFFIDAINKRKKEEGKIYTDMMMRFLLASKPIFVTNVACTAAKEFSKSATNTYCTLDAIACYSLALLTKDECSIYITDTLVHAFSHAIKFVSVILIRLLSFYFIMNWVFKKKTNQ